MNEYTVETVRTVEVKAKNPTEARKKALKKEKMKIGYDELRVVE